MSAASRGHHIRGGGGGGTHRQKDGPGPIQTTHPPHTGLPPGRLAHRAGHGGLRKNREGVRHRKSMDRSNVIDPEASMRPLPLEEWGDLAERRNGFRKPKTKNNKNVLFYGLTHYSRLRSSSVWQNPRGLLRSWVAKRQKWLATRPLWCKFTTNAPDAKAIRLPPRNILPSLKSVRRAFWNRRTAIGTVKARRSEG
jgi:hypothetical protein